MPHLFLYSDRAIESLAMGQVLGFLSELGLEVEFCGDFLSCLSLKPSEQSELNSLLQQARVHDIEKPIDFLQNSTHSDKLFEKELYDGFWVQRIFSKLFLKKNPDELSKNRFHLLITTKLLGTFDIRRYHARVVISGFPSLISTSGLVQGPARPMEYYFLKAEFLRLGKDIAELDQFFDGKFILPEDPRISKIVGAYVLQPLLYHFSGKRFCDDLQCVLFNSHWQEEVLKIQYRGALCSECAEEIRKIGKARSMLQPS